MTNLDIKFYIKKRSEELGFVKVGFTLPDPVNEQTQFNKFINNSYHGTMAWLAENKDKRFDPKLLHEGTETIVCFAMNYAQTNHTDSYKIARYALGEDYHIIIKEKLNILLSELKSKFNIDGRAFVDSAPVMERYYAEKAGIGWRGKNTLLITRDYGSYIFLAELFLEHKIEPDKTHENFCGSCTSCLDSCPTNAIIEPNVLDAKKCISYLTIEKRDDFAPDEKKLSNYIFGCDICQEVCPWNKFSQETKIESFKTNRHLLAYTKTSWHNLTEEDFKKVFKKSAIKRTKYIGLKRNIKANKLSEET